MTSASFVEEIMMHAAMDSPLGTVLLTEENGCLTAVKFVGNQPAFCDDSPVLRAAIRQLTEYFSGSRRVFDLPLAPHGTPFQRRCWAELQKIPYGQTISYGEEACRLGKPTACRAVGGANGRNPIPVIIPCHRVIAADGSLGGFSGGLDIKRKLLAIEGIVIPE